MLLRTEPGLIPVGASHGVADGLELVARHRPDVVLVEHHLPDGDGLSLTRRLKALAPAPQVIVYTADTDRTLALLARVAGADGLADQATAPDELFEAIRMVARGDTALPPLAGARPRRRRAPDRRRGPRAAGDAGRRHDGRRRRRQLRLDQRNVGRRIERMLGQLRAASPAAV